MLIKSSKDSVFPFVYLNPGLFYWFWGLLFSATSIKYMPADVNCIPSYNKHEITVFGLCTL